MTARRWRHRPAGSTWGDFGDDDEIGRLNLLTPEVVRHAREEIITGERLSLSLPLDYPGGQVLSRQRHPPRHQAAIGANGVARFHYPTERVDGFTDIECDDLTTLHMQYSTHLDGLAHIGAFFDADGDGVAEQVYYNGFRAHEHVRQPGDARGSHLGLERSAEAGIVGRGVMIDLAAHVAAKNGPVAVGFDTLERILDADRVAVEQGDIVCLHTGFSDLLLSMDKAPDAEVLRVRTIALDGRDPALLDWISTSGMVAVAADNFAIETYPARPPSCLPAAELPLHEHCIVKLGMHMGELWNLGPLARAPACRRAQPLLPGRQPAAPARCRRLAAGPNRGALMPLDPTFTEDFRQTPFWWDARRRSTPGTETNLPRQVDVLVIGAGVTGVEAGRVLAAGGRDVLVLDARTPGLGATARNAGQIGRNFKHPYSILKATHGKSFALGVFAELQEAYDSVEALGSAQPRETGWRVSGRVIGAMSPAHNDRLQREYALRAAELGEVVEHLDRDAIREEMNSELYVGGVRLPNNGTLQPALYHQLLETRARTAGARIEGDTPVTSLARTHSGHEASTPSGRIQARHVVVATNGYTGKVAPALAKRLLPITSYMLATEPLSPNRVAKALAGQRTYHDNRKRSHFFTVTGDGRRILMGGRTGTITFDERRLLRRLHGDLLAIMPELEGTRISHGWSGRCAAPYDVFPRFGEIEGIHYALGYSFSGMAMGPHLGRKVAALILGDSTAAASHFARPTFPIIPRLVRGPWTVHAMLGWQTWRERPRTFTRRM